MSKNPHIIVDQSTRVERTIDNILEKDVEPDGYAPVHHEHLIEWKRLIRRLADDVATLEAELLESREKI